MRLISNFLEEAIEQMDTKALEKYLSQDFEIEMNRHQMTLSNYRDHLAEAFKAITAVIGQSANEKPDDSKINVALESTDQKIIRWWELTSPDWQSM